MKKFKVVKDWKIATNEIVPAGAYGIMTDGLMAYSEVKVIKPTYEFEIGNAEVEQQIIDNTVDAQDADYTWDKLENWIDNKQVEIIEDKHIRIQKAKEIIDVLEVQTATDVKKEG